MAPSIEDQLRQLTTRAQAKNYSRGAHTEQDQQIGLSKHNSKTRKEQDRIIHRYALWHLIDMQNSHPPSDRCPPDLEAVKSKHLSLGSAAPDMVTVKDFLRFYAASSNPRIGDKITTESLVSTAEYLFGGLTRVTEKALLEDERSEIYAWIRQTLTLEGVVINQKHSKHNFTADDLTRILRTLWTREDLSYIHPRDRVQFMFLIHVYCWTGARIDAFFKGGLRYKDVELVLQRTQGDRWRIIYLINQRWVKNNRDPENIVFGAAGQEHDLFVYNEIACLLALAFADHAFFGFENLADLQSQRIPSGENQLILRWKKSALDLPILKQCTKSGDITDKPMAKSAFKRIFETTLRQAGYFCRTSIHAIRRELGKRVDESYTPVQRSQHLTQADPQVFGRSYVANCSSVDGQAAFRGEKRDSGIVDFFQGLEKQREQGLPVRLPAAEAAKVDGDQSLVDMRQTLSALKDHTQIKRLRQKIYVLRQKLYKEALKSYQKEWVAGRRDHKILSRGNVDIVDNKDQTPSTIGQLFPEKTRLATLVTLDEPLQPEQKWQATSDLLSICQAGAKVLYLPNAEPIDGCCPSVSCRLGIEQIDKKNRSQHIHDCIRRETARENRELVSNIHYCYLCFEWVVGQSWEPHCQGHLDQHIAKRCGTITANYTLVYPAFCPFCIGNTSLLASQRLAHWGRDSRLKDHIAAHFTHIDSPVRCPHPACDDTVYAAEALRCHMVDIHKMSLDTQIVQFKSRKTPAQSSDSKKRSLFEEELQYWAYPYDSVTEPPCKRRRMSDFLLDSDASLSNTYVDDLSHEEIDEHISHLSDQALHHPTNGGAGQQDNMRFASPDDFNIEDYVSLSPTLSTATGHRSPNLVIASTPEPPLDIVKTDPPSAHKPIILRIKISKNSIASKPSTKRQVSKTNLSSVKGKTSKKRSPRRIKHSQ